MQGQRQGRHGNTLAGLSQQYPQAARAALTVNAVKPLARAASLAAAFIDTGPMFQGNRISARPISPLALKG